MSLKQAERRSRKQVDIVRIKRDSQSSNSHDEYSDRAQPVIFENTYKMKPDRAFCVSQVQQIIHKTLDKQLKDHVYDPNNAGFLCRRLSDEVKTAVKGLGYNRHRIVCETFMIAGMNRTITSVTGFLWDQNVDNYVTLEYKGIDYVVVISLFAVFLE